MKNCISRRSFLKAAGILGAAGALAACGGSSSSTTTASSAPASSAAGAAASSTSIKLWTYPIGGWGNDETVQNLVSSFNAKYPDIKVTVEYLDYTNGDDQVNTAIEGGSAPDLIMEGPERLVANWGKKGVMAPLNDLWTDDAKKDIYASVESACKNEQLRKRRSKTLRCWKKRNRRMRPVRLLRSGCRQPSGRSDERYSFS